MPLLTKKRRNASYLGHQDTQDLVTIGDLIKRKTKGNKKLNFTTNNPEAFLK